MPRPVALARRGNYFCVFCSAPNCGYWLFLVVLRWLARLALAWRVERSKARSPGGASNVSKTQAASCFSLWLLPLQHTVHLGSRELSILVTCESSELRPCLRLCIERKREKRAASNSSVQRSSPRNIKREAQAPGHPLSSSLYLPTPLRELFLLFSNRLSLLV